MGALWLNDRYGTNIWQYGLVADSNALMAVANAVTSFMYFKNLDIKYSKIINIMGASTFGVLLIHANSDAMRQWLWVDFLGNASHYNDELFWLRPIVATLTIFIACIAIDYLRIRFIETPVVNKIFKKK